MVQFNDFVANLVFSPYFILLYLTLVVLTFALHRVRVYYEQKAKFETDQERRDASHLTPD